MSRKVTAYRVWIILLPFSYVMQCYCEQYLEKAVESLSVPARISQEQNSRYRT